MTPYRQLQESETGRIVVARLEVADNAWKRTVGLLGRAALTADEGLWLHPCNGIHTLAMRFSLDLLFLDATGSAIRLRPDLRPWWFCGPLFGARTVVELPAGTLAAQNIRLGYHYGIG